MEQAWTFLKADPNNIVSQRPQGDKEGMGAWQTMHPAVQRYGKRVSLPGMENNDDLQQPDIGNNTQFPSSDTPYSINNNQTVGRPEPLGRRDSPHRNLEYMAMDSHSSPTRLKRNQQAYQQFQQQQQQKPIEQGLPQMTPNNVMQQMQPPQGQ